MIDLNNEIQVYVTTRCNFHCRHCFLSCNTQGEDMTLTQGIALIDEISRMPILDKRILIAGGEPTLCFNLVIELVRRAAGYGIDTVVATNASWHDRAEKYVEKLAAAGLNKAYVSSDMFHLEYVGWREVKKVIDSLESAGIETRLSWAYSSPTNQFLLPALAVMEMCNYIPKEDVFKFIVYPGLRIIPLSIAGRANSLGCSRELGIKTWSVPLVVSLSVLPGNIFSLNCPSCSPWSRRPYKDGQLLNEAISWEMSLHHDIMTNPERVINSCEECGKYMAEITKEGGTS